MKRSFRRRFDEIPRVFEFTLEFYEANEIAEAHRLPIDFSIEEIFTNMVKYHPLAQGEIDVELDRRDGAAHVVVTDYDVDRFDVTATATPDLSAPLSEREVGGLGLHLTRQMMSTFDYEFQDRTSRVVMTKKLE